MKIIKRSCMKCNNIDSRYGRLLAETRPFLADVRNLATQAAKEQRVFCNKDCVKARIFLSPLKKLTLNQTAYSFPVQFFF